MKMRLSSAFSHRVVIFLFIVASHVKCQSSENYRLSNDVVPSIYDLHIVVDLEGLKFSGTETIYVRANQPTSVIELHLLDLSVGDVQVIQGENVISISGEIYNNETQIYSIALARSLVANGAYQIKMKFEGVIGDDMKGLYRSSYYENQVVKYMATTFSAAAYARKIFPCFDEPAYKAEFRLAITNKLNYVTLANTGISESEEIEMKSGDTWRTTRFDPTPVMSTYLLAFAVSEFKNITELSTTKFSVYSSETTISSMRYALDTGRKALSTLENYVGIPYDLVKMDFIAIDDFLMGAMENWGLVSFKSSRIMRPDGKRNLRKVQEITNIITHELVHMFFGNRVTCHYWNNVWLNEGFATYLENVIADKIQPHWHILDYFVVNRMHSVMLQDVKPKTHAMTRAINTPDEISKIYDFVAYPKAASVIRMIEHIMTPGIFQKALNAYILERSYKTATDEQLFEVLERTRRENVIASYPAIPEVFKSWANQAGFPILNVEVIRDSKTAKVSQELFVPFLNMTESSEFYILYNYATFSSGFSGTSPSNWIHKEAEVQHALEMKEDDKWMIFNVKQTGYYRVNYDNQNWNAIIDELNGENFKSIDTMNRAQLLDDSFNLARHGYLDFNIALNIIKYLRQEHELIPLAAGFKAIEFLMTFLDQQDFFEDLRDILLNVVDEIYVRINNSSLSIASEDEDYHVLTKLQVNLFACRLGAKSCLDDSREKLELFDYQKDELDIDQRPYLYCGILGSNSAPYNWFQLRLKISLANRNQALYRDAQEEINEIFHALSACDQNLDRVELILNDIFNFQTESTLSFQNVTKESALQVVRNLIKASSVHRSLMLNFYSENFEAVNEKAPFKETMSIFAEAINTQAHLERFISLASTAGLSASETITEIEENIRWLMMKTPEIGKWVESEKGSAIKLEVSMLTIVTLIFLMFLK